MPKLNSKSKTAKVEIKLSKPQEEIVDLLAHIMAAADINKMATTKKINDINSENFFDFYVNQLTPRQIAIFEHFKNHCKKVKKDLTQMLEKDLGNA